MLSVLILEQKLVWREGSAILDRRLMPGLSLASVTACGMHVLVRELVRMQDEHT